MHQHVVTRVRMSWDEALLFSVSEDGSLLVCDVRDKDSKAKGTREQDKVGCVLGVGLVVFWLWECVC